MIAAHAIRECEIPTKKFNGKEFERLVRDRCAELVEMQLADISMYGVMASVRGIRVDASGKPFQDVQLRKSFPDFEGSIDRNGTQTIFDAKCESGASFPLADYQVGKPKRLQVEKMYRRSAYGCPCFFLIHWVQRELKKGTVAPATYAFPVHRDHTFWKFVERGEAKSINRNDCEEYAIEVPWIIYGHSRTSRPDLLHAAISVQKLMKGRFFNLTRMDG